MTNNRKPVPLRQAALAATAAATVAARPLCPVCGTTTYSRSGIHPQCAQQQADGRRMDRLKASAKRTHEPKAKVTNPLALRPWHKRCPRCRAELHIRKTTCDCGHHFSPTRTR